MPYYRLFYHFVWTTKHRLPLITDHNREALYRAIMAKTKQLDGIPHALNGMEDHVHLVVTLPPTLALAEFIGQIKGSSSFVASRQANGEAFGWQTEYGVLSVSESHLPYVIEYVKNQQTHHSQNSLDTKLERFDLS